MSPSPEFANILTMRVDATSYEKATSQIFRWTTERRRKFVCVANVHMCMETFDNPAFSKVVNDADLVVPDGRPLVWALKLLGVKQALQVRGSDLLLSICAEAENRNEPIGLYGGSPESLDDFQAFLNR